MSSATTTHDISVPQGGPRLLIGGVMLAVMAAWVYVNHDPAPVPIVAMLAVAAAAGAALGVAGLREPTEPTLVRLCHPHRRPHRRRRRRLVGNAI